MAGNNQLIVRLIDTEQIQHNVSFLYSRKENFYGQK